MNPLDIFFYLVYVFFFCVPAYLFTMNHESGFFAGCFASMMTILGFPGAIAALVVMGIRERNQKIRTIRGAKERQQEQAAEQREKEQIEAARRARYESKRATIYAKYYNSALTEEIIRIISEPCPQQRPSEIRISHRGVSSYYNGAQVVNYDFITHCIPTLEAYRVLNVNGKEYFSSPSKDIRINYPLLLAHAINELMGKIYVVNPIMRWKISHKDYDDEVVTYEEGDQDYVQLQLRGTRSF